MIEADVFKLLFILVGLHFLADFPLQGYLATLKDRHTPEGANGNAVIGMLAHGWIHGLLVLTSTGFISLAIAEMIFHCIIDVLKVEKKINLLQDQILHIVCKAIWVILVVAWSA